MPPAQPTPPGSQLASRCSQPAPTHADARASQCVTNALECVAKVENFLGSTHSPLASRHSRLQGTPHCTARAVACGDHAVECGSVLEFFLPPHGRRSRGKPRQSAHESVFTRGEDRHRDRRGARGRLLHLAPAPPCPPPRHPFPPPPR